VSLEQSVPVTSVPDELSETVHDPMFVPNQSVELHVVATACGSHVVTTVVERGVATVVATGVG
jgi:hypothetical protein